MAQSKALRDALESFKKSGNSSWRMPIRIHKEYYLNSVASPIYINPVGDGF
jgi:protease-4